MVLKAVSLPHYNIMNVYHYIRLIIFLNLVVVSKVVGQNLPLFATVKMIKEKDPIQGTMSYAITITLKNHTDKSLYLPNSLLMYDDQSSDSIIIYKKSKKSYEKQLVLHPKIRKAPHVSSKGVFQETILDYNHLSNKYYPSFWEKKKESEKIINEYEKKHGHFAKSFNPLFLAPHESFTLYVVTRSSFFVKDKGDYKISFFYSEREGTQGFPDHISNYQKVVPRNIKSDDFFFKVKGVSANKIILNTKD